MIIILPFPVSVNALYSGGSRQQRFKSKKYKDWLHLCSKIDFGYLDLKEPIGRCDLHIRFYFPDNRERDLSNYVKGIEDFMVNNGILEDDNHTVVKRLTLESRGVDRKNPRAVVSILRA
jgi:Holliday junction resolvase RusA-like endonuclease